MGRVLRMAVAVLIAALVSACSNSKENAATSASPACAGQPADYWASPPGQAEVSPEDLAYLESFTDCDASDVHNVGVLATYLENASVDAPPKHAICTAWFAFVLNKHHGRFACVDGEVQFMFPNGKITFAELEALVRAALEAGSWQGLGQFFAEANAGSHVCSCDASDPTGGTGGTGASGSWGE